ncbi:GNAT family N-acetyltransferase [Alkalinema sp. FACHB-956]|uniref:GNAT family N-acetyltransferase n=1 Tax=Alkalinema sp. FACHB-956 TaxID=2692768 RepID=UPI0016899D9C|nr:GNAT family N-acetyltransferase [Alkalinema sp. FACHB-956]MBD2326909.1 GNAT family N-acetyltransferase [Alkalinema sp. FACHB-956]
MRDSALPQEFIIRPACRRDARSIGQLTRELANLAFSKPASSTARPPVTFVQVYKAFQQIHPHPHPSFQGRAWWGYFGWGVTIAIGLYYLQTLPEPTGVILAWLIFGLSLVMLAILLIPWINWSDYWVIEYQGTVVACAKLYLNPTHSEVYDVFVHPDWRGQGLGAALLQTLIQKATIPIYLASLPTTISFYQKLGFAPIEPWDLEPQLRTRLSINNPKFRYRGLTAMVLTCRG